MHCAVICAAREYYICLIFVSRREDENVFNNGFSVLFGVHRNREALAIQYRVDHVLRESCIRAKVKTQWRKEET